VGCKNIIEAKSLYGELFADYGGYGAKLSNIINEDIKWRGKKIQNQYLNVESLEGVRVAGFKRSRRYHSTNVTEETYRSFPCRLKEDVLYYCDLPNKRGLKSRAHTLIHPTTPTDKRIEIVYVLYFESPMAKEKFEKEFDIVTEQVFMGISTVPKTSFTKIGNDGRSYNSKYAKAGFIFLPEMAVDDLGYRRGRAVKSEAWEVADVDLENGEGVYVEIEGFVPKEGSFSWLKKILEKCKDCGIEIENLYGFKSPKGKALEVGDGWVELKTFIKNEIESLDKEIKSQIKKLKDYNSFVANANYGGLDKGLLKNLTLIDKSNIFYQFVKNYSEISKQASASNREMKIAVLADMIRLKIECQKSESLETQEREIERKYPLYRIISKAYNIEENEWKEFIKYVNCVS